jgi:beta-galactosidase-like protein
VRIPQHGGQIALNGHQAKILVTDFNFGAKSLLYSTAEVLSFVVFGDSEILALWLPEGETGEFTVKGAESIEQTGDDQLGQFEVIKGDDEVTVSYTQEEGIFTAALEDGTTILFLDRQAAYHFWVPTLTNAPHAPVNETGEFVGEVWPAVD